MKIPTAGLLIAAALPLAGCSQPPNLGQMLVSFRDRVVADAATADAERRLNGWREPWDYDGATTRRVNHSEPAKTPGQAGDGTLNADGTTTPSDPSAPPKPFQNAPSAPPVVYYYPTAPAAAPPPAP